MDAMPPSDKTWLLDRTGGSTAQSWYPRSLPYSQNKHTVIINYIADIACKKQETLTAACRPLSCFAKSGTARQNLPGHLRDRRHGAGSPVLGTHPAPDGLSKSAFFVFLDLGLY